MEWQFFKPSEALKQKETIKGQEAKLKKGEEGKRRVTQREKEETMLEKIVSLMSQDGIFDKHQERWDVGQVSCFVSEKPQGRRDIIFVALGLSDFMVRQGWSELLGIYKAELNGGLRLKDYDRIAPDELRDFPEVVEFLEEKGLGDDLEAKARKWKVFQLQQSQKVEDMFTQEGAEILGETLREELPLDSLELKTLRQLARGGGKLAGRNLAAKIGYSYEYMDPIYRSLGAMDLIDYERTGICTLTAKGRDLLKKLGMLIAEEELMQKEEESKVSPSLAGALPRVVEKEREGAREEEKAKFEGLGQKEAIERQEEKRRMAQREREEKMLKKVISLLSQDKVFDKCQERWDVGQQVSCFVSERPQEGWYVVLVALELGTFMVRQGWGDLLGIYRAELDNRLKLKDYDRIVPDEVEDFPEVVEFLEEKGLGDNLKAKAAKWKAFQIQQSREIQGLFPQEDSKIPREKVPLNNLELETLWKLALSGKTAGRNLAAKLGQSYEYMDHVYRSLGDLGLIDYERSGICILTPKGRELLTKMGWL